MEEQSVEQHSNGCIDHGVAVPSGSHRGIVAAADGDGRNVVLAWLHDHRGCHALLRVDAATGESQQHAIPFASDGDTVFASLLSSRNRLYAHFNGHFAEFDVTQQVFSFMHETVPRMAMGMTEDDRGRIWSVTYPDSGVACYDPATGAFRDYGPVHREDWLQYQRYVAADDAGWLYFGIGNTASQIMAFDPERAEAIAILPDEERVQGTARVFAGRNGKVYGAADESGAKGWYELHAGQAARVEAPDAPRVGPAITGTQGLFHTDFPDGAKLLTCSLETRVLQIQDSADQAPRDVPFDYTTEGGRLLGVTTAPDGTVCGATGSTHRFFNYDPQTETWSHFPAYRQWNTMARLNGKLYVGSYMGGGLLEWDPGRPYVDAKPDPANGNPRLVTQGEPGINRPHCLLAHPDGETLIMGGTPAYGYTGGGLLFWNSAAAETTLLEHLDVVPDQATASLAPLPEGRILGGTTTRPGTGGLTKATEAVLYEMDLAGKTVQWTHAAIPGAQEYMDLCMGTDQLVYGLANFQRFDPREPPTELVFFVFDPARRCVVHQEHTSGRFGAVGIQQGHRKVLCAPDGRVLVLYRDKIAVAHTSTSGLSVMAGLASPADGGGTIVHGRFYFACDSHLYSIPIA